MNSNAKSKDVHRAMESEGNWLDNAQFYDQDRLKLPAIQPYEYLKGYPAMCGITCVVP